MHYANTRTRNWDQMLTLVTGYPGEQMVLFPLRLIPKKTGNQLSPDFADRLHHQKESVPEIDPSVVGQQSLFKACRQ